MSLGVAAPAQALAALAATAVGLAQDIDLDEIVGRLAGLVLAEQPVQQVLDALPGSFSLRMADLHGDTE